MPTDQESLENYKKFSDEMDMKYYESIEKALEEKTPKMAIGRKAGREKKTAKESLKVHKYKTQLAAKRDEINFVENIIDHTRVRTIPTKWNPAIVNLYPSAVLFMEEGIIQENLRKNQGFK